MMVKDKVGIISFHKSINYGVYLQAYALQTYIEQSGYVAEIIDYNRFTEQPKRKKGAIYRITHFKETISIIRMLFFLHGKGAKEKEIKFENFAKNNFCLSNPLNSFDEIVNIEGDYEKFVCGSDQIWNPEYTQANPVYFLQFAPEIKRIAYAPSFGVERKSDAFKGYEEKYKKYIAAFADISVREETGQGIVEDICGILPKVVVDPTLLLSANHWEEKSKQVKIQGKYIVFYILGSNPLYRELAKKIFEQGEYSVICIPTGPLWDNLVCVEKCYAGVDEFIYLMRNAQYVITDSFHGTVFSVIFKKNFSAVLRNDTEYSLCSRLRDFLKKIKLDENCVSVDKVLEIDTERITDYRNSENILNEWINESKEFFLSALSREKRNE